MAIADKVVVTEIVVLPR